MFLRINAAKIMIQILNRASVLPPAKIKSLKEFEKPSLISRIKSGKIEVETSFTVPVSAADVVAAPELNKVSSRGIER